MKIVQFTEVVTTTSVIYVKVDDSFDIQNEEHKCCLADYLDDSVSEFTEDEVVDRELIEYDEGKHDVVFDIEFT